MSNNKTAEILKQVLADTYALYIKTQNYHWNVTGSNFKAIHELTELQYTELAMAIDTIAERIRALGVKAPGTFAAYTNTTTITPGDENASAEEMVADLAKSQMQMVKTLKQAKEVADDADDHPTEDMMIGRIQIHEKNAWMLSAMLDEKTAQKLLLSA